MIKIASIVEGSGEVIALPILLRRLREWKTTDKFPEILYPIKVHRDRFLNRKSEFSRHLQMAAAKCGDSGWILVVLDADDDCPAELARRILDDAAAIIPHRRISVVLANREWEAWFIAAAESLDGHRGFAFSVTTKPPAETPRDAKGWIKSQMTSGTYGETTDQPAFSALIDLQQAFDESRSFRKLCREWVKHVA